MNKLLDVKTANKQGNSESGDSIGVI